MKQPHSSEADTRVDMETMTATAAAQLVDHESIESSDDSVVHEHRSLAPPNREQQSSQAGLMAPPNSASNSREPQAIEAKMHPTTNDQQQAPHAAGEQPPSEVATSLQMEQQLKCPTAATFCSGLSTQGLQGRWRTLVNEPKWGCFLRHLPGALNEELAAIITARIKYHTRWDAPAGMPRLTAWVVQGQGSCIYGYGNFAIHPQPFPEWMQQLMQLIMPQLGVCDEASWPDSCNLNWYRSGKDSVAWHADSEDLFQGKHQPIRIISLSLGASRAFLVRTWGGGVVSQILMDGDLCLMDGWFQKYYQHQVPKDPNVQGERLNLTWRWIRQHKERCPSSL